MRFSLTNPQRNDLFDLDEITGVLRFKAAPNYEDPLDVASTTPVNAAGNNEYVLEVSARSGSGPRARTTPQTVVVTVTDVDEAPGKPDPPRLTAASATSVQVTWTEPANTGPPITDYDYRYRERETLAWTEVTGTTLTVLTVLIGGLSENTAYEVSVRAKNAEGTGEWSDPGTEWPPEGLLRLVNEGVSIYRADREGAGDCREFDAANPNRPDVGKPVSCPAHLEGRVEISHGGVFGTVSDDYWTDVEGRVACAMLDLDFDRSHLHGTFKPKFRVTPLNPKATGARPIFLDNLECEGDEESLADCQHLGWGIHNSLHSEDVAVRCVPRNFMNDLDPKPVELLPRLFHLDPMRNDEACMQYEMDLKLDRIDCEVDQIHPQTLGVKWKAPNESGVRRYRVQSGPSRNGKWGTIWDPEGVTQTNYEDWPLRPGKPGMPGEYRCYRVRAEYREAYEDRREKYKEVGWSEVVCGRTSSMWVEVSTSTEGKSASSAQHASPGRSRRATGEDSGARHDTAGPPARKTAETSLAGAGVTFTVRTRPPVRAEYRVCYRTEDGTAAAGADYVATEGELVFAAGDDRRTVDVELLDGGSGTFYLTVCNPSSGEELARGEATIGAAASRPAFTGRFEDLPAEHHGSVFGFAFHFSEPPADGLSFRTMRDSFFTTTGATVTHAKRITKGSNVGWRVQVEPDGLGDVILAVAPGRACDTQGAVCTADGRVLRNGIRGVVPGPAWLSVADATVLEEAGATLDFVVTLSRARHRATTVDYATSDATAVAGEDYTAASGTLTFAVGEIDKTIEVTVLDDGHDEGAETMTLTLSKATWPTRIARAEATGTIENSDAMPRAWLARFARTVGGQVLAAVEERLAAPAGAARARVAGRPLSVAEAAHERAEDPGLSLARSESRLTLAFSELLAGSSFALPLSSGAGAAMPAGGGSWGLWGRGGWSQFAGSEGALELDGDVASAVAGADYAHGAVRAGLALAYSAGSGSYRQAGAAGGKVTASLLSVHPYLGLTLNERLLVWGLLGYGLLGELELDPEPGAAVGTELGLLMGALGARGTLLAAGPGGGFELTAKGDALLLGIGSEEAAGLAASSAEVLRSRLLLEAAYRDLPLFGGRAEPGAGGGRALRRRGRRTRRRAGARRRPGLRPACLGPHRDGERWRAAAARGRRLPGVERRRRVAIRSRRAGARTGAARGPVLGRSFDRSPETGGAVRHRPPGIGPDPALLAQPIGRRVALRAGPSWQRRCHPVRRHARNPGRVGRSGMEGGQPHEHRSRHHAQCGGGAARATRRFTGIHVRHGRTPELLSPRPTPPGGALIAGRGCASERHPHCGSRREPHGDRGGSPESPGHR